jgi:hypothetical protein
MDLKFPVTLCNEVFSVEGVPTHTTQKEPKMGIGVKNTVIVMIPERGNALPSTRQLAFTSTGFSPCF